MRLIAQLLIYLILTKYPPERILTTKNLINLTHLTENLKNKLKERNNNVRQYFHGRKNSE